MLNYYRRHVILGNGTSDPFSCWLTRPGTIYSSESAMNSKSQTKLSSFLTTLLNLFGLWPNTSLKRPYKIYSYVLHFITSFLFCFLMLVKLVTSINNVEAIIELLYPTLMVLPYMFKLLNYYKYGDNIVNSFNKLLNLQLRTQSDDKMYNLQLEGFNQIDRFSLLCQQLCMVCSMYKYIPRIESSVTRTQRISVWLAKRQTVFLDCFLASIVSRNHFS